MKAYKGFNKDMTCRGFQFEEGKTYEEERAELCNSGFHACENPLDCLRYYSPAESVYHEVELEDVSPKRENDTKVCSKKIRIGARLSIQKFVELSIQYMKVNCVPGKKKGTSNTGDQSMASNTGNQSMASNTGYRSMASNTGDWSMASNTGDQSMASNTGYRSMASVDGSDGIAVASGYKSKAKAKIGCAICLVERGEWAGTTYPILAVKAGIVDGKIIKPDTWYMLKNGEFVEVAE